LGSGGPEPGLVPPTLVLVGPKPPFPTLAGRRARIVDLSVTMYGPEPNVLVLVRS
jgi:hypothetical protein